MQQLLMTIKRRANIIVVGYPIFCLLYWIWLGIIIKDVYGGMDGDIYWDGYGLFTILLKSLAIVGFFLFLMAVSHSKLHLVWISFASLSIPMACTMFIFWFLLPTYVQVDKARFSNHTYFILYDHTLLNDYNWVLLECTPFQISCNHISLYYDDSGHYDIAPKARFAVDGISQELHVVIDNALFYTVGSPRREYVHFLAGARLGDYTYHISRYEHESSVLYNLYKCDTQFACTKMPFLYTVPLKGDEDREFELEGDFFTKSIKVWSYDRWSGSPWEIVFFYDNAPHCYVEACSIPNP